MDGVFIGKIDEASEFVQNFRDQRKNGRINEEVSIYHDNKLDEVKIYAQRGRALRPLIIIKDGKSLLSKLSEVN